MGDEISTQDLHLDRTTSIPMEALGDNYFHTWRGLHQNRSILEGPESAWDPRHTNAPYPILLPRPSLHALINSDIQEQYRLYGVMGW